MDSLSGKARLSLTADECRARLIYNKDTGEFFWRVPAGTRGRIPAGTPAGYRGLGGYLQIRFGGYLYLGHRLAWLYVYGVWPTKNIDHINGDGADTRIANLREASQLENMHNSRTPNTNKSGIKGVCWSKDHKCWHARVKHDGKQYHVGYFHDLEKAGRARREAADRFHGAYARHA